MSDSRPNPLAIRIRPDALEQIKQRAKRAGLSTNAFIVRSALGTLGEEPSAIEARLDELEDRISRIEHYQQLGG